MSVARDARAPSDVAHLLELLRSTDVSQDAALVTGSPKTVSGSFGENGEGARFSFVLEEHPLRLTHLSLTGVDRVMAAHYKRVLLFVLDLAGIRGIGGTRI